MINKLGFGFLHLPKKGEEFDWDTICDLVDAYMAGGGRFFDTCYTYLDGNSERAIKECVVQRKERESFEICEKLPGYLCKSYADCQKYFDEELARCGVEYFDILMLHYLKEENYAIAEKYDEFRFLREKKEEGLAKRIGFSFHGRAALLEKILTAHPEVDVVLIQLNYLDWESEGIQSRKCYETCLRHGKKMIVMEPVKGGTLANIPEEAAALFEGESPAHRAIRFAASQEGVALVLSGMSTVEQLEENTRLMAAFTPLTAQETAVLGEAAALIRNSVAIPCTGCGYCTRVCPVGIPIPRYFSLYNERERDGWQVNAEGRYTDLTHTYPPADQCIRCSKCQQECPQKLPVSEYMKLVSGVFD